ncbi:MAG: glycosyltransferase, partial [Gelidibacter sp.]|nr:glycosyltransferase [Gelidibacter sp.]
MLDFIQSLGFVENNQRITKKQISVYLNRLKDEVAQRQVEIDRLMNELDKCRLEINQLTDQLAVGLMERYLEIQNLRNEVSLLNGTIAELRGTIVELQISTSWRITAPLRFLNMIIRKSKRLLCWSARQFVKIVRIVYRSLPLSIYRRVQIRRFYLKLNHLIGGEKWEHVVNSFSAIEKSYPVWFVARNSLTPRAVVHMRAVIEALPSLPLVSIVLPVHNPPLDFIISAIASVQAQIYENWELCIADDASDPEV